MGHCTEAAGRFPISYLVECEFSAYMNLVTEKRNRLQISARGDLLMLLTNIESKYITDVSKPRLASRMRLFCILNADLGEADVIT